MIDRGDSSTLRVATFNVRGCRGRSGNRPTRARLEHVGRDITALGADIVVLQEVDRYSPRSLWNNQARALARLTGATGVAHAAHSRLGLGEGVAALAYGGRTCRNARAIRLAPGRVALALQVGTLTVVGVHLSAADERDAQRAELMRHVGPAAIVAGDFNVRATSAQFDDERSAMERVGLIEAFSACGCAPDDPRRRTFVTGDWDIDRIYARGATVRSAEVVHCDSSDHWPVVADLHFA